MDKNSISDQIAIYRNEFKKLNMIPEKTIPESDEQFISDYQKNSEKEKDFFEKYGVGNYNDAVDRPFERMDAAVSEDIKILKTEIVKPSTPALAFFLLSETTEGGVIPNGYEMVYKPLIGTFMHTLQEYNTSSRNSIEIDVFRNKFVQELLNSEPPKSTLITAFYTFLLELQKGKSKSNSEVIGRERFNHSLIICLMAQGCWNHYLEKNIKVAKIQ